MTTTFPTANESFDDLNTHDSSAVQQQTSGFVKPIPCDQMWVFLLNENGNSTPNMKMLLNYLFSILCSNSYVESIFSHMKHGWNDYRNNMDIELVAAELQIRVNCDYSCDSFYKFLLTQPHLLKQIRTNKKYEWRN